MHFYDQIAWFAGAGGVPMISLRYRNAGTFSFADGHVPADSESQLSFRMSDHFSLWMEFDLPPRTSFIEPGAPWQNA